MNLEFIVQPNKNIECIKLNFECADNIKIDEDGNLIIRFDDKSLNELSNSIKRYGIIQPLVLRHLEDKYEIVDGERRYKAAKRIGLETVPAIVLENSLTFFDN